MVLPIAGVAALPTFLPFLRWQVEYYRPFNADDMHPIHGLLYDPTQENAEFAGSWYVGHLIEPLGHGWYHVRAYPGLD